MAEAIEILWLVAVMVFGVAVIVLLVKISDRLTKVLGELRAIDFQLNAHPEGRNKSTKAPPI